VTFWSLSVYDLAVPTSVYEKQKNSLHSQINTIEDNKDLVRILISLEFQCSPRRSHKTGLTVFNISIFSFLCGVLLINVCPLVLLVIVLSVPLQ
jgi:hypothetical protein